MSRSDYYINFSPEEFESFKWMNRIDGTSCQRFRRVLEQCVSPSRDPLKGRTVFSHGGKSSYFYDIRNVDDLMTLVEFSNLKIVKPGVDRTVALVFETVPYEYIGMSVRDCAVKGHEYRIELVDGLLQPAGPVGTKRKDEWSFTLVLTPRKGKDGIEKYVLTDAFPGKPDEMPLPDGLKEGDVIKGSEVMKRRLHPKGPEYKRKRRENILGEGTSLDELKEKSETVFASSLEWSIAGALNEADSFNQSLPQNQDSRREQSNPVFGYIPDSSTEDVSCFYPLEKIYGAISMGKQPAKFAKYFEISDLYVVYVNEPPDPEDEDASPEPRLSPMEIFSLESIKPGPGGIVYFIMKYPVPVGESVKRCVDPDAEYRVVRVGKRMIPVGPVELRRQEESVFTIVLIPKVVEDEDEGKKKEYLLMSAFPGRPDEVPDFKGLKDGDVISGAEVIARRLRPREMVNGRFDC